MCEPTDPQQQQRRGVPLWISLSMVFVVAAIISTIMFLLAGGRIRLPVLGSLQDPPEPLLVIDTRTPTSTPLPTATRLRSVVPMPVAPPTATATSTPAAAPTAAAIATEAPTRTPTPTATFAPTSTPAAPTPTSTPHVVVIADPVRLRAGPGQMYDVAGYARRGDALPLVARTANGEWIQVSVGGRLAWMLASLAQAQTGADQVPVASQIPPTPTATATPSPTATPPPTPLPAPVLIDPPSGASFGDKVRFTFTWFRGLQHDERVSIYVRSANGVEAFDWWVSEADILAGGGAIRAQAGGFVYEVNSGLGPLPPGEAFWRVAIFEDTLSAKRQVSLSSQERRILKK